MSDALEQAAIAFDTEIGGKQATGDRTADSDNSGQRVESLFGRLGEVDGDSPEAGGDDLPLKGQRRAKQEVVEDNGEELEVELDEEGNPIELDEEGDEEVEGKKPDEEEEDDQQPVYEVTVDGERVEVPLREALDGYIRQETFSRRLNWLNEVKQEVQKEAIQVVEQRKTYTEKLDALQKQLDMLVPAEPNWVDEYKKDPVAAEILQKQFASFKTQREAIDAEAKRVRDEQTNEDQQFSVEYVKAENQKILANNPGWKDPKVMERDINRMADTAKKAGFSDEEIQNTKDSRMVMILLKAAKYDALTSKKIVPIRVGKKPVNPGAGSVRTAPKGAAKAQEQLRRTGSVSDAANVFTSIIRGK